MSIELAMLIVFVFLIGAAIGLVPALTIYWLSRWWKNRPTRELCICSHNGVTAVARKSDVDRAERAHLKRPLIMGYTPLLYVSPVCLFKVRGDEHSCADSQEAGYVGYGRELDLLLGRNTLLERKFYTPTSPLDTTVEILPFGKFYEMVTGKIHQRASAEDESTLFHKGFDASGDRVDLPNA